MNPRFKLAKDISVTAGNLQMNFCGSELNTSIKSSNVDIVTEIDFAVQSTIISRINTEFPDDGILAEEKYAREAKSEWTWIIDPLDGTTNYSHGFPFYCVSIGLYRENRGCYGVIYIPCLKELFEAERDNGTKLNGKPVKCSEIGRLDKAMVATGFPYDVNPLAEDNVPQFKHFLQDAQAVRRMGSAAIALAYIACGRLDGLWEMKLRPWDMAAGVLMITESGGMVTGYNNEPFDMFSKKVVASNGLIHDHMIEILRR
jgi:myo-inositol-1(or 4)-monophosphatase